MAERLSRVYADNSDNGFYLVMRHRAAPRVEVRRFLYDYEKKVLVEMSEEDVREERQAALASDYKPNIAEKFLAIQGDRTIDA